MKTAELKYRALDWAVAKAKGKTVFISKQGKLMAANYGDFNPKHGAPWWNPSTNQSQGGLIIDREDIAVWPDAEEGGWFASSGGGRGADYKGPTLLIAAMRCYVASKLGDEVYIPTELTDPTGLTEEK